MAKAALISYKINKVVSRIFQRPFLWFCSGAFISYLTAYIFAGKKTDQEGIFHSIIFNVGNVEIHLHHWLFASLLLLLVIFPLYLKKKINPLLFAFVFGFAAGLIAQGVLGYSDWTTIILGK